MPNTKSPSSALNEPLSITVVGASGDLAMRKIFPALFALYCQGLLPLRFHIIGFARTEMSDEAFRERITRHLTCRYDPQERCDEKMKNFLSRCIYFTGQYDSKESFAKLHAFLHQLEPDGGENRIFYMSIPPFLFLEVANSIKEAGLVHGEDHGGWSRAVIEKPFGSDRASSDDLTRGMSKVFTEEQTFRIDHYLGKEVIQNLMVLRFANSIFDPIWNRNCVHDVRISWMENLGLEGRAGYFDEYGIIRDVMQNHLLQILALVAMEQPVSLHADFVRDEKVKVLRAIPALTLDDIAVGQYTAGTLAGQNCPGYLEEKGTPPDSITPTYAAAHLRIRNGRWDGVPFLIRAGKGLNSSMTEIRIRFREVPGNIFSDTAVNLPRNELVIQVQPDAGIQFRVRNKVPGLNIVLAESFLDLQYASMFQGVIPDAYESLLLDVIEGNKSLFIRSDELEVAWDIFTPVLHALEDNKVKPCAYAFGSAGPASAAALAGSQGVTW